VSLAKAFICGTVVQEAQKRFTPNNVAVTEFIIQVPAPPGTNPRGAAASQDASFTVRVVCWRQLADAVADIQRGQVVLVEGRLQINTQQTPDGVQKKSYEIDAVSVSLIPGGMPQVLQAAPVPGASAGSSANNPGYNRPAAASQAVTMPTQVATPQPSAAQPMAYPGGGLDDFSPDSFLTEDDIPF
jgi:single-strand DNA-binding protein